MNWHHWLIIGWFVLNAVLSVALIGKRIEATVANAVFMCFLAYPFLIWVLVTA